MARISTHGIRASRASRCKRGLTAGSLLLLAVLGVSPRLSATSFVRVSDESLVAGSPLIVVGTIETRDDDAGATAPRGRAEVATEYGVRVERILKGSTSEHLLRLRLPGGLDANGLRLRIPGVPSFSTGERVLLFLETGRAGSYRPRHLLLGAFRQVETQGGTLALRDLAGATEVRKSAQGLTFEDGAAAAGREPVRDFAAFARWIERRAAGRKAAPGYLRLDHGALPPGLEEKFLLLRAEDGLAVRWFEFDSGGSVSWQTHQSGQPGLTAGGALDAATAAACWNGDPATPIRYLFSGTTTAASGFVGGDDGLNVVLWNDPNGEIGPFSCAEGGILAIGGPWFSPASIPFNGTPYHPITSADVVLNDGIGCFLSGFDRPGGGNTAAEALLGHELGHTLGLDHSAVAGSLMLAAISPARNAQSCALAADDAAGAGRLYDPNAPAPLPAPPTGLTASPLSASEIDLAWVDASDNETGFHLEMKRPGGAFTALVSLPAGATSYRATGLAPATAYTFRVRASTGEGFSAYADEATATTPGGGGFPPCVATETAHCLDGRRFQVSVEWRLASGESGAGHVVPGSTSDSGLFWFFAPSNWEMMVKVLDGCGVNGRHWVFVGAVTDVEYTLRVVDGQSGEVRSYHKPGGVAGPVVTDTGAFAGCL